MAKKRKPRDPKIIAAICERVYRSRLGEKDATSMVEKDGDNGEKLRRRSMSYESIVRSVWDAIEQEGGTK